MKSGVGGHRVLCSDCSYNHPSSLCPAPVTFPPFLSPSIPLPFPLPHPLDLSVISPKPSPLTLTLMPHTLCSQEESSTYSPLCSHTVQCLQSARDSAHALGRSPHAQILRSAHSTRGEWGHTEPTHPGSGIYIRRFLRSVTFSDLVVFMRFVW